MAASTAVVWFRRDLRVHDHPALVAARAGFDRVVPLFVLDDALIGGRYASPARARFMLGCLRALDAALRERGSGLVVRRGAPADVVPALAREISAQAVLWTSDVAPYARRRDARVTTALGDAGVEARPQTGGYLVDVSRPRTQGGRPYTVFSPFHRAIATVPRRAVEPAPADLPPLPPALRKGRIPSARALGIDDDSVPEPVAEPGEPAARAALDRWVTTGLEHYAERHDDLSHPGTSVLSPHLRWGCVSARECEERAGASAAFTRQLAWRDFYAHQLLRFPRNVDREFQERYRGSLRWADDAEALQAWKDGRTGYPLVDAGMRQLARTGWMHNRARLVVGSFLTKDLHIDWREGERHFARLLLDGEPAQNNGNWQWIASTGADPAPYFRRLFNPMTQQRKFDPDGTYVRRWVPELRDVPDRRLAEPWTMDDAEQAAARCVIGRDYPAPIVDHAEEREVAKARYGAAAGR